MNIIQANLESVNKKIISLYIQFLLKFFLAFKIKHKICFLPKKTKRLTFLKSPHVFKKTKEHFILHKYKAVFYLKLKCSQIKYFILNKPNSVKVKLSFHKRKIA